MTRENYENMSVSQLKELAKGRGIKGVSAMRKAEVINALVEMDSAQTQKEEPAKAGEEKKPAKKKAAEKKPTEKKPAKKKPAEEKPAEEKQVEEKPVEEKPAAEPSGKEQPQTAQPEKSQGSQRKKISAEPRGQQGRRQENGARAGARQDGHARTIVRRAPAAGADQNAQAQQPRQNVQVQQPRQSTQAQQPRQSSQAPQIRPGAQAPQGQSSQAPQARPAAAPMTRGELRQSSPQPKMNDRAEMIQDRAEGDRPPMELKQLDSGNTVSGVLEVMADGYGFIRSNNYLPGEDDIYVSPSQIRRFNLKTGDIICGNTRVHAQQEKFSALLFVKTINGYLPSEAAKRYNFDEMTPIFPDQRLRMERTGREIAMRIVDILSPIGKGQRGLIVSPPKAGKTTLLKDIARSIQRNNPEMH
ncbi:MAG: Rho termination factor N-terminal domain-containing protein, partial [Lachnospiraceae bacterium]|nr:Rho termination factor N-terminal domain-containing protein [Lachnospiraceae bacterium]